MLHFFWDTLYMKFVAFHKSANLWTEMQTFLESFGKNPKL